MLDRIEPCVRRLIAHVEEQDRTTCEPQPTWPAGARRARLMVLAAGHLQRTGRRLVRRSRRCSSSSAAACCCWSWLRCCPGRWPKGGYAAFTGGGRAGGAGRLVHPLARRADDGPRPSSAARSAFDGFAVFITVDHLRRRSSSSSLFTDGYLRREDLDGPEVYALHAHVAPSGGVVMASANDLIVLFLGLEILSIALYVLAASHLRRRRQPGDRHQVLRARRLLVGVLPVRHRPDLRRHRHHEPQQIVTFLDQHVLLDRTACSSPASPCCSSASASRSRPCRSTSGRPTCTRARPRRSPASWPRRRRPRRSPRCCACFVVGARRTTRPTGSR